MMKQYMIHIEELNKEGKDKKVYIINKYQLEKIMKVIEEKDENKE